MSCLFPWVSLFTADSHHILPLPQLFPPGPRDRPANQAQGRAAAPVKSEKCALEREEGYPPPLGCWAHFLLRQQKRVEEGRRCSNSDNKMELLVSCVTLQSSDLHFPAPSLSVKLCGPPYLGEKEVSWSDRQFSLSTLDEQGQESSAQALTPKSMNCPGPSRFS